MSRLRSRLAMNKKAEVDQVILDDVRNCKDKLLQLYESMDRLYFTSDNQVSIQIFEEYKNEIKKQIK